MTLKFIGCDKEFFDIVERLEADRAELAKLKARINDLHDVPPEHESEPLAFHRGWELAVRAVVR